MSTGVLREVKLKFQTSTECWRFLLYLNPSVISIQDVTVSGVLNDDEITIACDKFDAQVVIIH